VSSYVLNACLTGMVPTKETSPHLPITPEEIVADALTCRERGAAIVHLHARDEHGRPTPDPATYQEILGPLRERSDAITCVTTSGRDWSELEKRSAVLELRPEMASLTLGSLNFPRQASVNSPETIKALAGRMLELGVKPELEVFEVGMVEYAHHLIAKGYLEPPCYFNILLGSLGTMEATAANLVHLVSRLPEGSCWAVGGVGSRQFRANCMGLAMGGGARVGLEDNLWMDDDRQIPASNPALVERVVEVGNAMELVPASPDEVRSRLGLAPLPVGAQSRV
jgi:3-keto-5-aminohexanoate cleavage enzyme